MPYIKQEDRLRFQLLTRQIKETEITNAGELNYLITKLITHYIQSNGTKYQVMNDIMGALSGADKEFYRKVIVPYEEEKEKENGGIK